MNQGGGSDIRAASSGGRIKRGSTDKTKGPKVHTSFRINPVVEMFGNMKGEKEYILKDIGLHGLTELPREEPATSRSFDWQFAFWLLRQVDSDSGSLDLGLRGRLEMRCEDVGQELQSYERVLIKRLSAIGLMEQKDGWQNEENVPETEGMGNIGMELATLDVGADGLDNPRPLCVVKSAEPVTATDIMQVVQDDELVVDDSYIEPNSKTWYIQRQDPQIEIRGELLQQMFTGECDLTMPAMNAIVRLFQEMDAEMYAHWREKRWRHFLPVEFAVISLEGLDNNNISNFAELAEMFVGCGINYSVDECRLILAPLMVAWHWSLYAWDFERSKIVVLDPLDMNVERHVLAEKHKRSVALMHRAMCECGKMFFPEAIDSEGEWETDYISVIGGNCESYNTGIYTMFYARYFDGDFITRVLTKGASRLQKMNILYQMLTMHGNEGDPPWTLEREAKRRAVVEVIEAQ